MKKSTLSLETRVQNLAQELQDLMIRDFVFTHESTEVIVIGASSYRPPPMLAVNRALRHKSAIRYYAAIFRFGGDSDLVRLWLCSLSDVALDTIKDIRVGHGYESYTQVDKALVGMYRSLNWHDRGAVRYNRVILSVYISELRSWVALSDVVELFKLLSRSIRREWPIHPDMSLFGLP